MTTRRMHASLDEIATVIDLVDRSGRHSDLDVPPWQYRLFAELARTIAVAPDTDEALRAVLEVLCRRAGWALGQAWVPSADGRHLTMRAFYSTAPVLAAFAETSHGVYLPFGVGVPGTVWATGLPAWVEDVEGHLTVAREHAALRIGLRAAGAFPIAHDRRVIAVAEFFFLEAREEDRLALLRAAAVGADLGPLIEARGLTHRADGADA